MSTAHLSSIYDITSLSESQIANLAAAVQLQIDADNAQINANNISIGQLTAYVYNPGGLQDQYNNASSIYNLDLGQYLSTSTGIQIAFADYSTQMSYYSSILKSSMAIDSTIVSYEAIYSTNLSTLQTDQIKLDNYNFTYSTQMSQYISNLSNYNSALSSINSTMSAMSYYSSLLSSATNEYNSTSTSYGSILTDYINYSTGILATSAYVLQSTQKYYSSLVASESSLISTITGTQQLSTFAGWQLGIAQIKQSYLVAVDSVNYYVAALDSAVLSTSIYNDLIMLDPTNIALRTLSSANRGAISSLSSIYLSTNAGRLRLEATQSTLQSTLSFLQFSTLDGLIKETEYIITMDMLNERNIVSTISGISASIRSAYIQEQYIQSTINGLSSNYLFTINTNSTLDGIMSQYAKLELSLSTQLISTLANVSTYQSLSSIYAFNNTAYYSTLSYWSTQELITMSSINGYAIQSTFVNGQISTIDGQAGAAAMILSQRLTDFQISSSRYYDYIASDISAQMGIYYYSTQLYNQTAGQCAADLLIKKIDNLNLMDAYYFQTMLPTTTPSMASNYNGQRYALMETNINIDNYVLNILNPLERKFYNLMNGIQTESTLRAQFIELRKAMFNIYEYPCAAGTATSTSISTAYGQTLAAVNTLVRQVTSQTQTNYSAWGEINTRLDAPTKASITAILGKNWFAPINTNAPATPPVLIQPANDAYRVVEPIPL